jgi:shikimate kinase
MLSRVSGQVGQRPLLEVENPERTIRDMLKARNQLYDMAADFKVNTSRLSPERVAETIIKKLKENESLDWAQ